MYQYQVNFSKQFINGLFEGRIYHDYLRFADLKSAKAYLAKAGETIKAIGGGDYIMIDATISKLEK